tara:strand:- start:35465 stop:35584 length:120 start_codon:yes stop_codon:yes gene_type:complete
MDDKQTTHIDKKITSYRSKKALKISAFIFIKQVTVNLAF